MWAILSDIHGNLEALQAVLTDALDNGVSRIVCLGDTVGYGPDPLECVRVSMSWSLVLQGNFEVAVLSDDDLVGWTALAAARSVLWFRGVLHQLPQPCPFREYLASRPRIHEEEEICFVHGTPRNLLYEYLFPEDITNGNKMAAIAQRFGRYCFNGHSHIPGIFMGDGAGAWQFVALEKCQSKYRFGKRKIICNVGSVGQPRDGDWRACYALIDGESVQLRRVEYAIETTVRKVYANPELDNFLAERLRVGR